MHPMCLLRCMLNEHNTAVHRFGKAAQCECVASWRQVLQAAPARGTFPHAFSIPMQPWTQRENLKYVVKPRLLKVQLLWDRPAMNQLTMHRPGQEHLAAATVTSLNHEELHLMRRKQTFIPVVGGTRWHEQCCRPAAKWRLTWGCQHSAAMIEQQVSSCMRIGCTTLASPI